jgi:hypothetical protein
MYKFSSLVLGNTQSIHFGNTSKLLIPDVPEGVPEEFKAQWSSLPVCCRRFYTHPGKGCCAGLPQPNPTTMSISSVSNAVVVERKCSVSPASSVQKVNVLPSPKVNRFTASIARFFQGIFNWLKHFLTGLWQDMKTLMRSL